MRNQMKSSSNLKATEYVILQDRCIKHGIQAVYLKTLSINRKDNYHKRSILTNHKSLIPTFNHLKMECTALSGYIQANQETFTQNYNS